MLSLVRIVTQLSALAFKRFNSFSGQYARTRISSSSYLKNVLALLIVDSYTNWHVSQQVQKSLVCSIEIEIQKKKNNNNNNNNS